jgi:hypothetical protein
VKHSRIESIGRREREVEKNKNKIPEVKRSTTTKIIHSTIIIIITYFSFSLPQFDGGSSSGFSSRIVTLLTIWVVRVVVSGGSRSSGWSGLFLLGCCSSSDLVIWSTGLAGRNIVFGSAGQLDDHHVVDLLELEIGEHGFEVVVFHSNIILLNRRKRKRNNN